jgi:hypothetical protein
MARLYILPVSLIGVGDRRPATFHNSHDTDNYPYGNQGFSVNSRGLRDRAPKSRPFDFST